MKRVIYIEIGKIVSFVAFLIIIFVVLSYFIVGNILANRITNIYLENDLLVEIQDTIRKDISYVMDNDYRNVIVTNNNDKVITYIIVMDYDDNDLITMVDNRVRDISLLNKYENYYILGEYDLEPGESKKVSINVCLNNNKTKYVNIKLKVIRKD